MPTAVRAAATALGRGTTSEPEVVAFGKSHHSRHFAPVGRVAAHSGPTLHVDFASDGGSLVVRDYPDAVNPDVQPDWPGYPVYLEARPATTGVARGPAAQADRRLAPAPGRAVGVQAADRPAAAGAVRAAGAVPVTEGAHRRRGRRC